MPSALKERKTSQYHGVYWRTTKQRFRWGAKIVVNHQRKTIFCKTEIEAALTYDAMAREIGRDQFNFPREGEQSFFPYIENEETHVPLGKNRESICDIEDFNLVKRYYWYFSHGYAATREITGKSVRLHQLINPEWNETDHIDRNPLNNHRVNLRRCNHSQNQLNRDKDTFIRRKITSQYKGVSWSSSHNKWRARIHNKFLGYFDIEKDAARAFNNAASQEFGEFAYLNNIKEES